MDVPRIKTVFLMAIVIALLAVATAQIEITGVGTTLNLNVVEIQTRNPPAHIFESTNSSLPISTSDFGNITFDIREDELSLNIDHEHNDSTNDTFFILSSGVYNLQYVLGLADSSPNPTSVATLRIVVNGEEVVGSSHTIGFSKSSSQVELSGFAIVRLNAGDRVSLQAMTDDADVALDSTQSLSDNPDSATIGMFKLNEDLFIT